MDFKLIDTHMHYGHDPQYMTYDASLESLMRKLDRLGIEYTLNLGIEGLRDEYAIGIEKARWVFENSGHRIYGMFHFGPLHPEPALTLIRENAKDPVFRGIKIHPSGSNENADDERYRPVWEVARECGLPIYAHTWAISSYHPSQQSAFAGRFERFAKEYPDVTLVFAHSGGRWGGLQAAAKIGRECPNTYFDIAGDIWNVDVVNYLVENVGEDRVLWGSDYSMIEQRPMLGVLLGADLPLSVKKKIFRENAMRLFFSDLIKEGAEI